MFDEFDIVIENIQKKIVSYPFLNQKVQYALIGNNHVKVYFEIKNDTIRILYFHEVRDKFIYTPDESIRLMGVRIKSKDQIDEATKKYQNYIRNNNNQLERNKALQYPSY